MKDYIRTCIDCKRRKSPPAKPAGSLQPIQGPQVPLKQIGMTLLGPLRTSSAGKCWVTVATDYLIRYAETKANPRGTDAEVAQFFIENIVMRHGAQAVVITDRRTVFTAGLLHHNMMLSGATLRKTTAYHPQTNGLTMRLNKTIEDMISMYVDIEHKKWDNILPNITFAYNTAREDATWMTPFRLVHGREVRTTLGAMIPHEPVEIGTDAEELTQRAEEARQLERARIHQPQEYDAQRYNVRHRPAAYELGDKVWVWTLVRQRGLPEKILR